MNCYRARKEQQAAANDTNQLAAAERDETHNVPKSKTTLAVIREPVTHQNCDCLAGRVRCSAATHGVVATCSLAHHRSHAMCVILS